MAIEFDGDVVVVTGAGRGLGRTYATLLAARGARIVVNDIGGPTDGSGTDSGPAAEAVAEITEAGGTAIADTHDGSTPDGAKSLIANAVDAFGRVDAVIANAGILRDGTFHKADLDDFFSVLDVHLGGTVRVFREAYPLMREQEYGRLVTTTSAAGLFGNFGQANYAAAKMALVGLTRVLAIEGAKSNVKVNAIAPAAATRMTEKLAGPLGSVLDPALVAPLAAYLCHPSLEASGEIISAGGGRFARVRVGVTAGVAFDDPTPEDVATGFGEILAASELDFPANVLEEIQMIPSVAEAMARA